MTPLLVSAAILMALSDTWSGFGHWLASCTPAMAIMCLVTVWGEGRLRIDYEDFGRQGAGGTEQSTVGTEWATSQEGRQASLRAAIQAAGAAARVFPTDTCPICFDDLVLDPGQVHSGSSGSSTAEATGRTGPAGTGVAQHAQDRDSMDCDGSSASVAAASALVLPCGHGFHDACIVSWLVNANQGAPRCPMCRESVFGGATRQLLF